MEQGIQSSCNIQGMLHVPDPIGYRGVIIAKRRMDAPISEEPIVYAYAKMVPKRRPVVASEVILGLAEDKDRVTRYRPPYTREKLRRGLTHDSMFRIR